MIVKSERIFLVFLRSAPASASASTHASACAQTASSARRTSSSPSSAAPTTCWAATAVAQAGKAGAARRAVRGPPLPAQRPRAVRFTHAREPAAKPTQSNWTPMGRAKEVASPNTSHVPGRTPMSLRPYASAVVIGLASAAV